MTKQELKSLIQEGEGYTHLEILEKFIKLKNNKIS